MLEHETRFKTIFYKLLPMFSHYNDLLNSKNNQVLMFQSAREISISLTLLLDTVAYSNIF